MTVKAMEVPSLRQNGVKAMGMAVLLLAIFLLTVYGFYLAFTTRIPSGNDFFSRWAGARALLLEGKDPYSDEVTLQIQIGMFGHPQPPEEDQGAFAYPLYVIFTFLPLIAFPYAQAQALWMATLVFLLAGGVFLILRTLAWKPSGLGLAAITMGTILFYPTGRGVLLGQFAIVVLAFLVGAWWALVNKKDGIAGALLALSTIKPQMVVLLIPFFLLWALVRKRWGVILGFGMSMLGLFFVSWLMLPNWHSQFWEATVAYQAYTQEYTGNRSPIGLALQAILPGFDYWPTVFLSLALIIYAFFSWYRARADNPSLFWQAWGMAAVATLLIPIQTGSTNQVLLIPPLLYGLHRWAQRGKAAASIAAVSSFLLVAVPWGLFLATLRGDQEHPIMFLPIPLFALLVFTFSWPHPSLTPVERKSDG